MHTTKRVIAIAAIGILSTGVAFAEHYQLDTAHTQILFKVKHLGISTVTGQFNEFSGFFNVDPNDLGIRPPLSEDRRQIAGPTPEIDDPRRGDVGDAGDQLQTGSLAVIGEKKNI